MIHKLIEIYMAVKRWRNKVYDKMINYRKSIWQNKTIFCPLSLAEKYIYKYKYATDIEDCFFVNCQFHIL